MSSIFIYIFIFVNYLCIRYNSFVFGKALYLVKFEDFPEDNTWLPITSLQGCLEMVYQFNELLDRAELQNSEAAVVESSQINETEQELGKNKLLIGLNAELGLFGR